MDGDHAEGSRPSEDAVDIAPNVPSNCGGTCNPCIYWASARGCTNGGCDFCHLHHRKPEGNERPRRAKRDAIKQQIFEYFLIQDERERHRLLQEEAAKHPFARNFVKGLLDNPAFNVRIVGQDFVVSL